MMPTLRFLSTNSYNACKAFNQVSGVNKSDYFRTFEGIHFNPVCYIWGREMKDESTDITGTRMSGT